MSDRGGGYFRYDFLGGRSISISSVLFPAGVSSSSWRGGGGKEYIASPREL